MPRSLPRRSRALALAAAVLAAAPALLWARHAVAQDPQPWNRSYQPRPDDPAAPPPARPNDVYQPRSGAPRVDDAYRPPRAADPYQGYQSGNGYGQPGPAVAAAPPPYGQPPPPYGQPPPPYGQPPPPGPGYGPAYAGSQGYGQPYSPPPNGYDDPADRNYGPPGGPYGGNEEGPPGTYSSREILQTGHSFFGSVSKGLANVVEYAFKNQGRPNGYILGQEAGGAFVAGLRYGEGVLYTRDAGSHRVYWQGPSIGYDAGAEGSKVMILVYNLRDPGDMYQRFGGVEGSAYFVGGVGITFQKSGDIVAAPIRSGVGLRLGANVGYLKYTPRPTWNPF